MCEELTLMCSLCSLSAVTSHCLCARAQLAAQYSNPAAKNKTIGNRNKTRLNIRKIVVGLSVFHYRELRFQLVELRLPVAQLLSCLISLKFCLGLKLVEGILQSSVLLQELLPLQSGKTDANDLKKVKNGDQKASWSSPYWTLSS